MGYEAEPDDSTPIVQISVVHYTRVTQALNTKYLSLERMEIFGISRIFQHM